ncbi:MAG: D-glycero-alpha-D-manno-heptose-1,7-bisphosphate 7-phosphatase [Alphaproteobacteria bacterium]
MADWPPVPAGLAGRVAADGLWRELRAPPAAGAPRPALFLDRDGTIIDEVAYISRPGDVRPIPEALTAIRRANALAVPVVVVTNQGGIGRGYVSWSEFAGVEAAVNKAVTAAGGRIDAVYAAPHAPSSRDPAATPCRKPGPGMLLRAADDLNLDLGASWIAGDCASDLAAGRNAGLPCGWLVPTGYGGGDGDAARALARADFEVVVGATLAALATRLAALAARD